MAINEKAQRITAIDKAIWNDKQLRYRGTLRAFLMVATPAELGVELVDALDGGDFTKARVIAELLGEIED